jgi:hypothetical protein
MLSQTKNPLGSSTGVYIWEGKTREFVTQAKGQHIYQREPVCNPLFHCYKSSAAKLAHGKLVTCTDTVLHCLQRDKDNDLQYIATKSSLMCLQEFHKKIFMNIPGTP